MNQSAAQQVDRPARQYTKPNYDPRRSTQVDPDVAESRAIFKKAVLDAREGRATPEVAAAVLMALRDMPTISSEKKRPQTDAEIASGLELRRMLSILDIMPNNVLPKNKMEKIQAAFWWYAEDDLLQGIIDLKANFGSTGFSLACRPVSNTLMTQQYNIQPDEQVLEQATFQRSLDKIKRKLGFSGIVWNLMRDFFVCQSMILYWKVPGKTDKIQPVASDGTGKESKPAPVSPADQPIPNLIEVAAIDPRDVDWDNSLGSDNLSVTIPQAVVDKINAVKNMTSQQGNQKSKLQELVGAGIPSKYIDAVIAGKNKVSLDRVDGDNWIIRARQRKNYGLADPTMYALFRSLAIRRIIQDGDFALASRIKHFIFHGRRGESIQTGPLAGQRSTWATKEETDELLGIMTSTTRSATVATDHTVKFEFILPPSDALSSARYEGTDAKIYNWGGVSIVLHTGGGGKYGSGYIGIKRLMVELILVREMVDEIVTEFFDHPSIASAVSKPEYFDVGAAFNANALKEPRQILDELKIMISEGMGDPQMTLKELDRDPSTYRQSKLESIADNEASKVWEPVYRKLTGGADAGAAVDENGNPIDKTKKQSKAGRPANANTTVGDHTTNQEPSPKAAGA